RLKVLVTIFLKRIQPSPVSCLPGGPWTLAAPRADVDPPVLGYDAGMPVHQDLAYNLLKSVSKLEFQLRRHGDFFRKDRDGKPTPDVAWRVVEARVRQLGDAFAKDVPGWARQRLLSQRDVRPMKQKILDDEGRLVARFMPCPLDAESDAVALVEAMRQVRNNLFHGGKEDYEDDPYAEDDDWVHAATQVALALQRSLDAGLLDAGA
ncbi:hypothetical protein, partial [Xanthomonas sp. D-99]|uniref:hypothetical protein n=1 Tax=Xanthomonas sp. D-99 TaxID=2821273 RepID=UPI001FD1CF8C